MIILDFLLYTSFPTRKFQFLIRGDFEKIRENSCSKISKLRKAKSASLPQNTTSMNCYLKWGYIEEQKLAEPCYQAIWPHQELSTLGTAGDHHRDLDLEKMNSFWTFYHKNKQLESIPPRETCSLQLLSPTERKISNRKIGWWLELPW